MCHCTVKRTDAGQVWVTHTPDRSCPEHVHGQRWEPQEVRQRLTRVGVGTSTTDAIRGRQIEGESA